MIHKIVGIFIIFTLVGVVRAQAGYGPFDAMAFAQDAVIILGVMLYSGDLK